MIDKWREICDNVNKLEMILTEDTGMGVHDGHRDRLRALFANSGGSDLPAHNLFELLLFYGIPRRDTNHTAHLLLERFGDIKGVLGAPYERLLEVEGIDKACATLIRLCGELFDRADCEESDINTREYVESFSDLGLYVTKLFLGLKTEHVFALLVDSKGDILSVYPVCDGDTGKATFNKKKLLAVAMQTGAAGIVLAHNHPNGLTIPSQEDILCTQALHDLLETNGIELVEHYIVAEKRYRRILSTALGTATDCDKERTEVNLNGLL